MNRMTRRDYEVQEEMDDLADELADVTAERDALRAQLDAMTEEWRTSSVGLDDHGRVMAIREPRYMKRLVGPWVEVTD